MNKNQLQKELLEKIKAGIKPSDLKKNKLNKSPELPEQNNTPASTPPASPILRPKEDNLLSLNSEEDIDYKSKSEQLEQKNKELKGDVKYWSNIANNHLSSLQKLTAELDQKEQIIKELESKNKSLNKTQGKNTEENKGEIKLFTCSQCDKSFSVKLIRLIDKDNNKTCRDCINSMLQTANQETGEKVVLQKKSKEPIANNPEVSQKNEYDLLTPELWDKYPYSDADEILEQEFGIKKNK